MAAKLYNGAVDDRPDPVRRRKGAGLQNLLLFREDAVRLKKEQIDRLAERVLSDLSSSGVASIKSERGKALATIASVIRDDLRVEEELEAEAERLLEETLRSMGGGSGIDRHKMLKMIKEKLARERNLVL